jgi:hypothetical protein
MTELTDVPKITRNDFFMAARSDVILHNLLELWLRTTESSGVDFEQIQIAGCVMLAEENHKLRRMVAQMKGKTIE